MPFFDSFLPPLTLPPLPLAKEEVCGKASWYGPGFHGRQTANGEVYNQWGMTAAHKTLPFGTKVLVKWEEKTVEVRINDRGPYVNGRIIDLSLAAMNALGATDVGVPSVCLEYYHD